MLNVGKADSDDELDYKPTWAKDIGPYVQKKYDQAFAHYESWQQEQMKGFTTLFNKKLE